jgi:CDP-glucose 4,6-dehydratase
MRALMPPEIRLATARGGNVIGGGDWSEDRLVPDLARAIGDGRPVVLRNPGALRPWQHVLELVRGYLTLGAGLLAGEALQGGWNFGPGRQSEITVGDLANRFASAWGEAFAPVVEPSPLHEAHTLRLDISKAHALLGWRPMLGIEETVRLTADWYRARAASPAAAANLTRDQIAAYRKRAIRA